MATVHSYARFSTKKQEIGDSEKRQNEGLMKFIAKGKHTLSDLRYLDAGKSGFRGNKQKHLDAFLDILRANDGRIKSGDILYVEAIDRLSRKGIRDTQKVVNSILTAGVSIAISLPVEKTYLATNENDLGDAVELVAFAFAAHSYSKSLSDRVKSFHRGARERAYKSKTPINSGSTPAWLIRNSSGFSFKPGAKEAIAYIYQRTIDGLGGKRLVGELNEKFICFARKGRWSETYMRMILTDRRAMGEMQPHIMNEKNERVYAGDPISGYYPSAISEETWRLANASSANRRVERGGRTTGYVNLFTGLVWNVQDQCPMHLVTYFQTRVKDKRKVIIRRLKSVKATDKVAGACHATIGIEDFEYVVLQWLRELDKSAFTGENSNATELASLVSILESKKKRIHEIETDESGAVSLLMKQLTKLTAECEEISAKINALKIKVGRSASADLDHLSFLEKLPNTAENRVLLREAIKRVVARIAVLPVKLGTQKRSPVGSLIELELHNGHRRQLLQLAKGSISNDCCADMPLMKEPNIAKKVKAVTKALAFLSAPACP